MSGFGHVTGLDSIQNPWKAPGPSERENVENPDFLGNLSVWGGGVLKEHRKWSNPSSPKEVEQSSLHPGPQAPSAVLAKSPRTGNCL